MKLKKLDVAHSSLFANGKREVIVRNSGPFAAEVMLMNRILRVPAMSSIRVSIGPADFHRLIGSGFEMFIEIEDIDKENFSMEVVEKNEANDTSDFSETEKLQDEPGGALHGPGQVVEEAATADAGGDNTDAEENSRKTAGEKDDRGESETGNGGTIEDENKEEGSLGGGQKGERKKKKKKVRKTKEDKGKKKSGENKE